MLNVPVVHQEVYEKPSLKLTSFEEIEYKQIIKSGFWKDQQIITTVINKNNKNGKFTITIKDVPFSYLSFVVSINNKINYISNNYFNKHGREITISSTVLNDILFKDVSTIAIGINVKVSKPGVIKPTRKTERAGNWERIAELNIKIKNIEPTNKVFFINQNGLLIETYNQITFVQNIMNVSSSTTKSLIKIVPENIVLGKHNVNMFSILNISKTEPPLIVAKTIEGLEMHNSTKKIKAIFQKSITNQEIVKGIVGNINFWENTYYDLKEGKTFSGIGLNSEMGYIVPYNFKGNLIPILNIDIGSIQNIIIGFSHSIKNAYFEKNNGLIKLQINEADDLYDENHENKFQISNFNFPNLISNNLSLLDIFKLEENVQKNE